MRMTKYLDNKNYAIEIMLSEKYGDGLMDVNVQVSHQDGGGKVYSDSWTEEYKTVIQFKKNYGLLGKDHVIVWRFKC